MGFPTKLQHLFVPLQVESIFYLLSASLTLLFGLSLMLLIFVMFNLFVETKELDAVVVEGGDRQVEITRDKQDSWLVSWEGVGLGVRVWSGGGLLALCPCCCCCFRDSIGVLDVKKETENLSEDGIKRRGSCHRWTFCDLLSECTWLCCAEVQLPLSHLSCPLQCPDAAPLTHPLTAFLSEGGQRWTDESHCQLPSVFSVGPKHWQVMGIRQTKHTPSKHKTTPVFTRQMVPAT